MAVIVAFFLAGFFGIASAVALSQRARQNGSRWPRARRVFTILLGLIGAYVLLTVVVFLLQPVFNY